MKTLSAPAVIAAARPTSEPIYLMQIDFAEPATILRISDAARIELGEEWLPLVQSWGSIEESLNVLDPGGSPATFEVTLFNTKPVAGRARISDLIRSTYNVAGAYEFKNAKVTIMRLDAGLGQGDEEILGVFYLEEPTEIDERLLRLRMSDESLLIENAMDLVTITPELFPNADPDEMGQTIPVAFGSLTNIRARAIVAGASTPLTADVAVGATSLAVTDTSRFPAPPFDIQLDSETKTCTAKTATSLTIGALAAAHVKGAQTWELRSGAKAYRFAVCENRGRFKTKNALNVRAMDVLVTSGITIDLDDTTLVPGRSFVVINFAGLPFVRRQGNVDTIGITSLTTLNRLSDNTPLTTSIFTTYTGETATVPSVLPGTIVLVQRTMNWAIDAVVNPGSFSNYTVRRDGSGGTIIESGSGSPALGARTTQWSSGTTYGNQELGGNYSNNGGPAAHYDLRLASVTESVEIIVDSTKAGTVLLSGDSSAEVLFGSITCDVEGLRDDSVGSLSGVGGQQLTNPADIIRLALRELYGATADFGASWLESRSRLAQARIRWDGLIGVDGATRFSDFRRQAGEQALCRLFLEGGRWELIYLDVEPVPAQILDYNRDVWEDAPARPLRTDRTRVFGAVIAKAQRDYSGAQVGGGYLYTRRVGPVQVAETTITLTLVKDQATTNRIADYWQEQWSRQRWQVDLVGWQGLGALEKGDGFALQNHPILAAHGGASLIFRIIRKRQMLGDDNPARIGLTAVEANP